MKKFALLFLVVLLLPACAVTKAEYTALLDASESYRSMVAPVFTAATASDPNLAEQSRVNRLKADATYGDLLRECRARLAK